MKITCQGLDTEWQLSAQDSGGWMSASIFVKVPSFEGSFRCSIEHKEWDAFVQRLRQLESSIGNDVKLSWSNMQENVELSLSRLRSSVGR